MTVIFLSGRYTERVHAISVQPFCTAFRHVVIRIIPEQADDGMVGTVWIFIIGCVEAICFCFKKLFFHIIRPRFFKSRFQLYIPNSHYNGRNGKSNLNPNLFPEAEYSSTKTQNSRLPGNDCFGAAGCFVNYFSSPMRYWIAAPTPLWSLSAVIYLQIALISSFAFPIATGKPTLPSTARSLSASPIPTVSPRVTPKRFARCARPVYFVTCSAVISSDVFSANAKVSGRAFNFSYARLRSSSERK